MTCTRAADELEEATSDVDGDSSMSEGDAAVVVGARASSTEVVKPTASVMAAEKGDAAVGSASDVVTSMVDCPQASQEGYGHQLKLDVAVGESCRPRIAARGRWGAGLAG